MDNQQHKTKIRKSGGPEVRRSGSSILKTSKPRDLETSRPQDLKFIASCFLLMASLFINQIAFAQAPEHSSSLDLSKIKLQAVLTPPYVLGPGDQLIIIDRTLREAFGLVEQYNVTVSSDGYISIPLPDGTQENISAAGLTLDDLSKDVREAFGRTLKNPLLFVQILRYRPINVYIGGEVVKPGIYKVETTTTSEKGATTTSSLNTFGLSLTQAIQLAGGVKPRADIKGIVVTRGTNSQKKVIDLTSLLKGEDTSQDINLQPGDAIFVPVATSLESQAQNYITLLGKLAYQEVSVSITGEVSSPGNFILPSDATLLDAIGMAGGPNNVGSWKKVKLSRFDEKGVYKTYDLNVHDLLRKGVTFDQIALRPNDAIRLEPSKGKEVRRFFRETGTNLVSIVAGTAIGTAGGFLVQDSFIDRLSRISRFQPTLPGGSSNAITIIGGAGKRVINENKK